MRKGADTMLALNKKEPTGKTKRTTIRRVITMSMVMIMLFYLISTVAFAENTPLLASDGTVTGAIPSSTMSEKLVLPEAAVEAKPAITAGLPVVENSSAAAGPAVAAGFAVAERQPAPEDPFSPEEFTIAAKAGDVSVLNVSWYSIRALPHGGFFTWSLVDLVLTIMCVLSLALLALKLRLGRSVASRREDIRELIERNSAPLVLTAVALVATVVAIVLFLLTQDMSLPMVLFDWWTAAFSVLFVIVLSASMLVSEKTREAAKEEQQELLDTFFESTISYNDL